jgi:hypothetical protein
VGAFAEVASLVSAVVNRAADSGDPISSLDFTFPQALDEGPDGGNAMACFAGPASLLECSMLQSGSACAAPGRRPAGYDRPLRMVFSMRPPFIFLATSRCGDTHHALREQLRHAEGHIFLCLSTQVTRRLLQRPNLDLLRNKLAGAAGALDNLQRLANRSPASWLDAIPILPLPSSVRAKIASILSQAAQTVYIPRQAAGDRRSTARSDGSGAGAMGEKGEAVAPAVVYAVLFAGYQVAAWSQLGPQSPSAIGSSVPATAPLMPRQWPPFALRPHDSFLLSNVLQSSPVLRDANAWMPLTLPSLDPAGRLHALACHMGSVTYTGSAYPARPISVRPVSVALNAATARSSVASSALIAPVSAPAPVVVAVAGPVATMSNAEASIHRSADANLAPVGGSRLESVAVIPVSLSLGSIQSALPRSSTGSPVPDAGQSAFPCSDTATSAMSAPPSPSPGLQITVDMNVSASFSDATAEEEIDESDDDDGSLANVPSNASFPALEAVAEDECMDGSNDGKDSVPVAPMAVSVGPDGNELQMTQPDGSVAFASINDSKIQETEEPLGKDAKAVSDSLAPGTATAALPDNLPSDEIPLHRRLLMLADKAVEEQQKLERMALVSAAQHPSVASTAPPVAAPARPISMAAESGMRPSSVYASLQPIRPLSTRPMSTARPVQTSATFPHTQSLSGHRQSMRLPAPLRFEPAEADSALDSSAATPAAAPLPTSYSIETDPAGVFLVLVTANDRLVEAPGQPLLERAMKIAQQLHASGSHIRVLRCLSEVAPAGVGDYGAGSFGVPGIAHFLYLWKPARQFTMSAFPRQVGASARRRKALLRAYQHVYDELTLPTPILRHFVSSFAWPRLSPARQQAQAHGPSMSEPSGPIGGEAGPGSVQSTEMAGHISGLHTTNAILMAVLDGSVASDRVVNAMERLAKVLKKEHGRLLALTPGIF